MGNNENRHQKPTLQEKLAKRQYHTPSRAVTGIYDLLGSTVLLPKYAPHIKKTVRFKKSDCPFILVWNHLSRLDHLYSMKAVFPVRYNMVAGYSEFFRSHLHVVFRLNQILPKKVYDPDMAGLRAINSILKSGGAVALSPEGMSSIYGTNQPVVPGSGRLLQYFGVPVYFMKMRGQYLTSTKHFLEERKGRTEAEVSLLFTPEQLKEMTSEQIDDKLNEVFRHDEFEWTKKEGIRWKMHGHSCEHLDEICYRCPRCGTDLEMEASGSSIRCMKCGNGAVMNDYYAFEPFDADCVIPESPSKWVEEERVDIIRRIREDSGYSFSENVTLGELPEYTYVKKKKTSEECGSGVFTLDHGGVHFRGKRHGSDFSFDMGWANVFSLAIMTSTAKFSMYINGEFLEFTPERRSVGKMLLIAEEMHRLHYNIWKNFPWNDWMYEGLELGTDRRG
ncbi:MAG: hypothetical protein J6128_00050 [Clostridia bacterium]|nr:hypothetical protein [Clostridia bacterium]